MDTKIAALFRRLAPLALLAGVTTLHAQTTLLTPFVPVDGELTGGGAQAWTFNGHINEPISLLVETTSGDLDPIITVRDDTGQTLIANDDYNYPDSRDSMLEAFTLPDLGVYTVTVSALGSTAGDYRLTMQPGYASFGGVERFEEDSPWAGANSSIADGLLTLSLPANERTAIAFNPDSSTFYDFRADVTVDIVAGQSWTAGMTVRQQDENAYLLYEVNYQAQWRVSLRTAQGEEILRDWTRHPALRTNTSFTLGIMTMGTGYDFFYNSEFIGRFSDTRLDEAGHIGLVVGTTLGSPTTATFDNLIISVPVEVNDAPVVPQQILTGDYRFMTTELQRRHLIPAEGGVVLTIPQSSTEYGRPGVNIFPLASGSVFTNLALATTVYPRAQSGSQTGCGLALRVADERNYILAYVDATGAYGVSQRRGSTFEPGLYGENSELRGQNSYHLLIIANANTLHYYINGQYIGALDTDAGRGGIGNAVVNFEPLYTTCQFTNTWLYEW
jgi:hypothetical protein